MFKAGKGREIKDESTKEVRRGHSKKRGGGARRRIKVRKGEREGRRWERGREMRGEEQREDRRNEREHMGGKDREGERLQECKNAFVAFSSVF